MAATSGPLLTIRRGTVAAEAGSYRTSKQVLVNANTATCFRHAAQTPGKTEAFARRAPCYVAYCVNFTNPQPV